MSGLKAYIHFSNLCMVRTKLSTSGNILKLAAKRQALFWAYQNSGRKVCKRRGKKMFIRDMFVFCFDSIHTDCELVSVIGGRPWASEQVFEVRAGVYVGASIWFCFRFFALAHKRRATLFRRHCWAHTCDFELI